MIRLPPRSTLTATLFPCTTLVRSDYRVGARGGITDTIDWSVEGAYGESENVQTIQGYTLQSRWREASLVDSVGGVATCQSGNPDCVPVDLFGLPLWQRSEEHTSELQSLMRLPYSVFYLTQKT